MRFLLSFIIASSILIAPFGVNAGEVSAKKITTNFESNTSVAKNLKHSVSTDFAVAIINSNYRGSSSSQYRLDPFNNSIYSVSRQDNLYCFYKQKYFAEPHLYCKRIGLKLIFPEHYFW